MIWWEVVKWLGMRQISLVWSQKDVYHALQPAYQKQITQSEEQNNVALVTLRKWGQLWNKAFCIIRVFFNSKSLFLEPDSSYKM